MQVVHCKKEKYTVYIGRPRHHLITSKYGGFGNPYKIGRDGSREEVIKKFEEYARKHLMAKIATLKETDILGCWCKPEACHGDIIIKLWHEITNGQEPANLKNDAENNGTNSMKCHKIT